MLNGLRQQRRGFESAQQGLASTNRDLDRADAEVKGMGRWFKF